MGVGVRVGLINLGVTLTVGEAGDACDTLALGAGVWVEATGCVGVASARSPQTNKGPPTVFTWIHLSPSKYIEVARITVAMSPGRCDMTYALPETSSKYPFFRTSTVPLKLSTSDDPPMEFRYPTIPSRLPTDRGVTVGVMEGPALL